MGNELARGALLCLLSYGHVYVWPTLGSGNFEDRDLTAERWKAGVCFKVYKLMYLCVFVCVRGVTWVAQVGFLGFILFEDGKDPRACFVSAFSYNCSRSPRTSCIRRLTRRHDYPGDSFIG